MGREGGGGLRSSGFPHRSFFFCHRVRGGIALGIYTRTLDGAIYKVHRITGRARTFALLRILTRSRNKSRAFHAVAAYGTLALVPHASISWGSSRRHSFQKEHVYCRVCRDQNRPTKSSIRYFQNNCRQGEQNKKNLLFCRYVSRNRVLIHARIGYTTV